MIFQINRLDGPTGVGTQYQHKGRDPGKVLCQRNGGPGNMIVHLKVVGQEKNVSADPRTRKYDSPLKGCGTGFQFFAGEIC